MQVTAFGFVLMPLCLVFFLRPGALLRLTLLASAFGAAAPVILNFGGEPFGLQSGFLPGLLFIGATTLDYFGRRQQEGERQVVRVVLPMLLFAACALVGAVILPRLFAGQFKVWPQSAGFLNLAVPLQPNSGNITQGLYVVVNTAFLLLAALYLSRPGTRHMLFVRAYLMTGYIVVGLCLWQFANKLTGLYYPSDFLYSNPRWAILTDQAFGEVNRINGPFTEPAQLSTFLSGIVFGCLWMLLRGSGGFWVRLLLFLSIGAMWLSTSTTGIIIIAVFVPAILLRSATTRELQAIGLGLCAILGGALMLFVVSAVAVPSIEARVEASVNTVVEATLNKSESGSYDDRTTKDSDSIGLLVPSYGLGAGWGSVRSSSLVPGVIGNSGLLGAGLLVWFAIRATGLVARARKLAPSGEARTAMEAMTGSILGTLLAACLSAPTINEMEFYARLAIMIGCAARICLDARARATAPIVAPEWPAAAPAGLPRNAR
ncbi:MAG: hypothetical protein ACLQJR_23250 [Stellaceae bacterium]